MAAAAQKYKMFRCVQDLTCPGRGAGAFGGDRGARAGDERGGSERARVRAGGERGMGEEIPGYFRGQRRLDAHRWVGPAGIGNESWGRADMNRRHFALGALIGAERDARDRRERPRAHGTDRQRRARPRGLGHVPQAARSRTGGGVRRLRAVPRKGHRDDGRPRQALQGFPAAARAEGYRRGDRGHARSLARADHSRGLRSGQGRVLREAALADRDRRPQDAGCGAQAQSRGADGQPAALGLALCGGGEADSGWRDRRSASHPLRVCSAISFPG